MRDLPWSLCMAAIREELARTFLIVRTPLKDYGITTNDSKSLNVLCRGRITVEKLYNWEKQGLDPACFRDNNFDFC